MGLVDTEAIILRTYKLAEADKIFICLTQKNGLVRGVARGARRLKSRFGASLEPFTHVAISYFEKEGRELVSLRHAEIIRSYFNLAGNTETVAALEYLSELALEFSPPNEPNEKMFRMVRACVEAIAQTPANLPAIVRYYELWTLRLAGFLPDLRTCANCRRRLKTEGEVVYFNPESALTCSLCTDGIGMRINADAHAHLRSMQDASPGIWAQALTGHPPSVDQELAQLTRRLITNALEHIPRGHASYKKPL